LVAVAKSELAMNQAEGNTSEMEAFIIVGNSLAAPPVQQRSNPQGKRRLP